YQWLRCNAAGASCTNVGTNANTYALVAADVGSTMRVQVTASNAAGPGTAVQSAQTAVVTGPPAVPVNSVLPVITGTAQAGSTLTSSTGTWSGSPTAYAYQWLRCNAAGASCTNVGTNANTYALVAADVGSTMRVQVTASNAGGPGVGVQSAPTGVVVAAPSSNKFGQQTPGANAVAPDQGYKFGSSYTLTEAATTQSFSWYVRGGSVAQSFVPAIYATDVSGNPTTLMATGAAVTVAASAPANWVTSTLPSVSLAAGNYYLALISGPTTGGAANYYDVVANAGRWNTNAYPTPSSTWGATNTESLRWSFYVTYTPAGPPVAPLNSVLPVVTGAAAQGTTLSATTGTWSGSPTAYAYQWLRCNAAGASCTNVGTNANTYPLVAGDVGSTMRVQVTASNAAGPGTPAQSVQTAVVTGPPPVPVNTALPTISGTTQSGQTLNATSGTWSNSPTSYAYQWLRCNTSGTGCLTIGSNAASYVLAAADVSFTIRVQVTASNAGGPGVGVQSAPTGVVVAAPSSNKFGQQTPGANAVAPDQGYKFGSSYTLTEAATTQSFSWYVRGGSVAQSFVPAIYATDVSGNPTTLMATGAAVTVAASAPANWVTSTLPSVSLAAGNYYLALISGPTTGGAANYYDVVANAGRWNTNAYPTPSSTWGATNTESLRWSFYVTYTPSAPPSSPPVNTALPTITGTTQVASTLNATTGTWTNSPTSYAYQWLRCNAAGASCTNIGTNTNSYTLVTADVASTIRVRVTASNSAGPGTAVQSAQTAAITAIPPVTLTPGDHSYSEVIGGRTRTWTLMVPSQISTGPLPMVVVLHGADYTGALIRSDTGYDTPAQRDGFIVAYPDAFGGTWNDGRANVDSVAHLNNIDDVGFLSQMIAEAIATGAVNQSRVYVTGFSNGAMMAARLTCERTSTFAAAALVAGFGPGDPALSTVCSPSKGLPIMSVASTADPIIPYNGGAITSQGNGNRGVSASASDLLSLWRTKNACTSTTSSNIGGTPYAVNRIDSVGCAGGLAVRHDVYANPNHIWMRETNYDTTETTWAFVRTFTLP
ncbi:MAG: PHB depolymerase family esterase, partial [Acidimicrobiia bacterium]